MKLIFYALLIGVVKCHRKQIQDQINSLADRLDILEERLAGIESRLSNEMVPSEDMNEFKTEVNKALASFELEVHKGIEYVSTIKKDIIQVRL